MLRELENLLAEIARQQGLDVPRKGEPQRPPRPRPEPDDTDDLEIIEAEPIQAEVRRPVVPKAPSGAVLQQPAAAGEAVGQAETQLHQKFDRSLSDLDADAYKPEADAYERAEAAPTAAEQIVEWFRSPQATRQAIIMNEILQRPEDRW